MDTFNRILLSAEGADDSAQSFDSFVNSHGTGIGRYGPRTSGIPREEVSRSALSEKTFPGFFKTIHNIRTGALKIFGMIAN
ncbi:MAG: hypothetical protein WB759_04220, partial [Methanoregula sp.]